MTKRGLLLIDRGSREKEAKDELAALCTIIKQIRPSIIFCFSTTSLLAKRAAASETLAVPSNVFTIWCRYAQVLYDPHILRVCFAHYNILPIPVHSEVFL